MSSPASPALNDTGAVPTRRFRVAFSFTGEKRGFVEQVAAILAAHFGEDRILYDKYHEAEFAKWGLGFDLPALYRNDSDLVVAIVCPQYVKKKWTSLEWMEIHELNANGEQDRVMLCHFEYALTKGLNSLTGFIELDKKSPQELANLILQRLALSEGKHKNFYIEHKPQPSSTPKNDPPAKPITLPPNLLAVPAYMGSHGFIGRVAELDKIDDWAAKADTHAVLLFEAMGGSGKSMLTWEWVNRRADKVRGDWAGKFWYSFYERGTDMEGFCRHALAYVIGVAPETLRDVRMPDLTEQLLAHLKAKPYLMVLDGLERVLVAYNRIDASSMADDEVDDAQDQIGTRNPCDTIRPDDGDFLRALAAAQPSKLLVSSRLTPRAFISNSNQPVQGVRREFLGGLRPTDAEAMMRAQGVTGDGTAMHEYLTTNCACHPLVIGAIAGMVNTYGPARGDFDAWVRDTSEIGGGRLNLADLDLKQKKNHILRAAIQGAPAMGRKLLKTMSLIHNGVDFAVLKALNPHADDEPAPTDAAATKLLSATLEDLLQRGLVQHDRTTKRYDLHPVVRGVARGDLSDDEKNVLGQDVVDYFSAREHSPYKDAKSWDDVADGIQVMRTFLAMGQMERAAYTLRGDLTTALLFNLEAHAEVLALLQTFFPAGWHLAPDGMEPALASYLMRDALIALRGVSMHEAAWSTVGPTMRLDMEEEDWSRCRSSLTTAAFVLHDLNNLRASHRCSALAVDLATAIDVREHIFVATLFVMDGLRVRGEYAQAQTLWDTLDPMGRSWPRATYRPGTAEYRLAALRFAQGQLTEADLQHTQDLATRGSNRGTIRSVHALRGEWRAELGEWDLAATSLSEAVHMARAVRQVDSWSETFLALANHHRGTLHDGLAEAQRLAALPEPADRPLAELFLALGDRAAAVKHALAAYTWAWADGEPYVHRAELDKSAALLQRLGEPVPSLPPFDESKHPPFDWEADVRAAIEKLKAEKAEKAAKQAAAEAKKAAKAAKKPKGGGASKPPA